MLSDEKIKTDIRYQCERTWQLVDRLDDEWLLVSPQNVSRWVAHSLANVPGKTSYHNFN